MISLSPWVLVTQQISLIWLIIHGVLFLFSYPGCHAAAPSGLSWQKEASSWNPLGFALTLFDSDESLTPLTWMVFIEWFLWVLKGMNNSMENHWCLPFGLCHLLTDSVLSREGENTFFLNQIICWFFIANKDQTRAQDHLFYQVEFLLILSILHFHNCDFCCIFKMLGRIFILVFACIYTQCQILRYCDLVICLHLISLSNEGFEDLVFFSLPKPVSLGYEKLLDSSLLMIFPTTDRPKFKIKPCVSAIE